MKHQSLIVSALGVVALASCSDGGEESESWSRAGQALLSLELSNFEIDESANLGVDGAGIDWSTVAESRSADIASGPKDKAFGRDATEDTPVPHVVSGGVGPSRNDLKSFGFYLEGEGEQRYLHLYWLRVRNPSGPTNMDFEFNQGRALSANKVTPLRTSGDVLIQYDLSDGDSFPELSLSRWIDGSEGATEADCEASTRLPCWGNATNLSEAGMATGAINLTRIRRVESDDLGRIPRRTFGELSIDLGAVFPADGCVSFNSVYLKNRLSDSFTAKVKDFIAPQPIALSNCAGDASLSNITVSVESQTEGGTSAKISCADLLSQPEDATPANYDDHSETYYGVRPGTYTCTVVIDR